MSRVKNRGARIQGSLFDPLWELRGHQQGSPVKLDLDALIAQSEARVQAKAKAKPRSSRRQRAVSTGELWGGETVWHIVMQNTSGTSSKFWRIEGVRGSSTVRVSWGKIGRKPQGRQVISLIEAVKRMKKKLKDDYVYGDEYQAVNAPSSIIGLI